MRNYLLILAFLTVFVSVSLAGLVGRSEYDVVWEITVIDCQGYMTVYRDCRIVNAGQFWISFMPNQGQIATSNGREVHINTSETCVKVIKREVDWPGR